LIDNDKNDPPPTPQQNLPGYDTVFLPHLLSTLVCLTSLILLVLYYHDKKVVEKIPGRSTSLLLLLLLLTTSSLPSS